MGVSNIFAAGGVVMYPLLGFSVLAVSLIIERILFWMQINGRQERVVHEVLNLYKHNNIVSTFDKLKQNAD
jgi:biopolymer transport protein ExbB